MKVFALFMHNCVYGKSIGGIERRFIEVTKHLKGIEKIYALEYHPSLSKEIPSGYIGLPVLHFKAQTVTGELKILIRLSLISILSCRKFGCDVVYSPRQDNPEAFVPAFFTSLFLRKPLAIVFHSLPPDGYGVKTPLQKLMRFRLANHEGIRKATIKTVIDLVRRLAYSRAEICFAVSETTQRHLCQFFTPRRVIVSGNGVGDEWFEISPVPKNFDVAYLGRIHPRKRLELLIQAWKEVLRKQPRSKLLLIGGGDSEHVKHYQMMIAELGLQDSVTMTGFLDDASIRRHLSSARIFAFPSSREGFGLAIAEAMACGLPCLLSDIPPLREAFSGAAVFVSGSDPSLWANALSDIIADKDKQAILSNLSRSVANSYRWKDVANREGDAMMRLGSKVDARS